MGVAFQFRRRRVIRAEASIGCSKSEDRVKKMGGWITYDLTAFSIVFQSYEGCSNMNATGLIFRSA